MSNKLIFFTFLAWGTALGVWQIIFNSGSVLSPVLWEIHTIFTCVILFFVVANWLLDENFLDVIKIIFRILFKVWFVILVAFSMKKSFDIKGLLLTATFAFGYLEGLIDLNAWTSNQNSHFVFSLLNEKNNTKTRIPVCIICLSLIHIFSAFIALAFFNFK